MKHILFRHTAIWLFLLMTTFSASADNLLTLTSATGTAGEETLLDINLANASDIVGLQFDIELPYGKSNSNVILSTDRSDGHQVSLRRLSDTRYTVIVMSFQNNALKGNSGRLLQFPIAIPAIALNGVQTVMKLTNIVLTSATGDNVATQMTSVATFTIENNEVPDFVVSDLSIANSESELTPGGKLRVNFNVTNQGTAESRGGWTEKVYLKQDSQQTLVATKTYGNTLDKNNSVNRLYEVDLPQALGMSGTVKAVVTLEQLVAGDEQNADTGNNTAESGNSKTLTKNLFFGNTRILLTEGQYKDVRLTRSGSTATAETFTLAESNDHNKTMLSMPASVTIAAGRSYAEFRVTAVDDSGVNTEYRTGITVASDSYGQTSMTVDIKDNDNYSLRLTTDKTTYTEGEGVTLTATIAAALESDLKVNISNTAASRLNPYVRSITIPAGQLSATAQTTVKEDNYPASEQTVTFQASATGYDVSTCSMTITDNDWPELTMKLSRTTVSEADGYGATMATITRSGSTQENVTVFVASNAGAALYFDSQKNIIPAGQTSITIPVSVEDNSLIDGDHAYTLSAAVCDAYTGRAVESGHQSYCTTNLTVTDNDTEKTLKLQCGTAQLLEGGGAASVTIIRNATEGASTVQLSSDDVDLDFPATVTIADGNTQATFTVKANANSTANDSRYSSVTATLTDYQTASFVFYISDETLPDAAILTAPGVSKNAPYAGESVTVTVEVTNQGLASLPAGANVKLYVSSDRSIRISDSYTSPMLPVGQGETNVSVPVGESQQMTFDATLPEGKMGQLYLFAWVNQEGTVSEINGYNNRSTTTPLNVMTPATLTSLTTDKAIYQQGEIIHISGTMSSAAQGISLDGRSVDVYLIDAQNNARYTTATMNAAGEFTAEYTVSSQMGGGFGLGACVNGAGSTETTTHISVSALKIETAYLKLDMTEGVLKEGNINVTNRSEQVINNLTFAFDGMPDNWTITLPTVTTLAAGATTQIHYSIMPSTASIGTSYVRNHFRATAQTANNTPVESEAVVDYYCKAASCKLVTNAADGIVTTVSKTNKRSLSLLVQNSGLTETGDISVVCPESQPWLTASVRNLSNIEAGEQAGVTLTLECQDNMVVDGTYQSYVKLKPENGTAIIVPVKATVVSNEKGNLTVDVVDAYTLGTANGDGPHVSGASVRLTNSLTGEVVMTGTTDANGIYSTDILPEGTYYIYITAANHNYVEKTMTVSPGTDNTIEVFLPYKAVNVTYTVEETTVVDEYRTIISMDVVPDTPQAVVVPTLPSNWGCGLNTYSIRLTNKGRLTAYSPYLEFPNIEGYTFKVKSEYPQTLYPNESYDVTIEFEGPDDNAESYIGAVVMHYGYQLQGQMYYGQDVYAAQVGCKELPLILPGGGLGGGDVNRNYGDEDINVPRLDQIDNERDETGSVDMPTITYRDYTKSSDNTVKLQFEQRFLLERQAFKGHLTVENLQMNGIEDITLVPSVKTVDDQDASDLFAISFEGMGSWKTTDEWTLAPNTTGEAYVHYVPAKEAAPTVKTDYLFGGTLTYRDVETGQLVIVELMQTKLTVNPSPDLHLTYFLQRDFIGDNPLTEEVEPWEPAQFALLIQNKGTGNALNLKIETSSPQIVDNKNNLPVTFTQLYTTIDGQEGKLNFNSLDLGNISAGQNIMARWWFYSNVSAHVANYNVTMTKASDYGEEFNLITIDAVRELTRSVRGTINSRNRAQRRSTANQQYDAGANIFLVNIDADEEHLPDHVYDADGTMSTLNNVSGNSTLTGSQDAGFSLSMQAGSSGWCYSRNPLMINADKEIASVVRQSDDADLTANAWLTTETVNGEQVRYLHLADYMNAGSDTYVITLKDKPASAPQFASITLVKDNGSAGSTNDTNALITFAGDIDTQSIDADDVVLTVDGEACPIIISSVTSRSFMVSWSAQTVGKHCSLTAFTSDVMNTEGTTGTTSMTKEWNVTAYPLGDVNGDNSVTVTDIMAMARHIMGNTPKGFVFDVADVTGGGDINITDIMALSRIIMNSK